MSSELLSLAEEQLKLGEQQGAALRMLFNGMKQMQEDVSEKFEEVQVMVQEVRDSVTLTDTECYNLQQAVRVRSCKLTKDRFKETDGDYKSMVGKYRRLMWSKLKEHFEKARYSHIRRVDYEEAMLFIKEFRPEDYI